MNKITTAVLGVAVAVLPVFAASPAFAQDDRDCTRAQREVTRVELKLSALLSDEREAERAAVQAAKDALALAETGGDKAAIDAAKQVLKAAREALNVDSKRLANLRVDLKAAIADRDEACDEDPEPTPTTTPAPTTTPPVDNDVDCAEVSDARAQEILDADRNDPHNLDDDNDGVACEEETVIVNNDVVVTPSGGVNTGGWRR